jgi:predicted outer membrane repeat protein
VFWKNTAMEGGAFSKTGTGMARIDSCTFYRNSAPSGSGLYVGPQSALLLTRSIVARNHIGGGVYLADGGTASLTCCDLYANDAGDWTGGIANQLNRSGNTSANPMFCDGEEGDLGLDVTSPCAEPACGRQGARPARCDRFTYYVGAAPQYQYNTIEQALAAAMEGGRIVLVDSLYAGEGNRDLTIPRRGLTIESAAMDPAACVLDVQGTSGAPHRAFELRRKHGVTFRGITVRHGWMLSGGAIYAESADSAQILNCAFRECTAGGSFTDPGGGAVCVYGDSSHGGRTVIRDCSFDACTSRTGGGAVSLWYRDFADTALVENCIFSSNTARDQGGALAGSRAGIKVSNSIFRTNSAPNGGAVMVDAESHIRFESCTMVGNAATGKGECAYLDGAKTEGHFKNCILAANSGRTPIACSSTPGTMVTVVCCNLWPHEENDWSGCLSDRQSGNIHEDPQFCAPQTGDYRLCATSPCSPDQSGNQGCGLVGALPVGCGPLVIPEADKAELSFRRCGPNPFHHEIRIDYVIPARAAALAVDIAVYDAGGRLVRTIFQGTGSPGEHSAHWDALDDNELRVGSGVFFCRLRAGTEEATQRLIVLR